MFSASSNAMYTVSNFSQIPEITPIPPYLKSAISTKAVKAEHEEDTVKSMLEDEKQLDLAENMNISYASQIEKANLIEQKGGAALLPDSGVTRLNKKMDQNEAVSVSQDSTSRAAASKTKAKKLNKNKLSKRKRRLSKKPKTVGKKKILKEKKQQRKRKTNAVTATLF